MNNNNFNTFSVSQPNQELDQPNITPIENIIDDRNFITTPESLSLEEYRELGEKTVGAVEATQPNFEELAQSEVGKLKEQLKEYLGGELTSEGEKALEENIKKALREEKEQENFEKNLTEETEKLTEKDLRVQKIITSIQRVTALVLATVLAGTFMATAAIHANAKIGPATPAEPDKIEATTNSPTSYNAPIDDLLDNDWAPPVPGLEEVESRWLPPEARQEATQPGLTPEMLAESINRIHKGFALEINDSFNKKFADAVTAEKTLNRTGNQLMDRALTLNPLFDASTLPGCWNDPEKGDIKDNRIAIMEKAANYYLGKTLDSASEEEILQLTKFIDQTDPQIAGDTLSCMYEEYENVSNEKMAEYVKNNPEEAFKKLMNGYEGAVLEKDWTEAQMIEYLCDGLSESEKQEVLKVLSAGDGYINRNTGKWEQMTGVQRTNKLFRIVKYNEDGSVKWEEFRRQDCDNPVFVKKRGGKVVIVTAGDEGSGSAAGSETSDSAPNETPRSTTNETPDSTGNETDKGKTSFNPWGDQIDVDGPVDPKSEVPKEENDNKNKDKKGYVDDGGKTPGEGSEVEDGGGGKLPGGEQQDTDGKNGEDPEKKKKIEEGKKNDEKSNEEQRKTQEEGEPGESNNSDNEEEEKFEKEEF